MLRRSRPQTERTARLIRRFAKERFSAPNGRLCIGKKNVARRGPFDMLTGTGTARDSSETELEITPARVFWITGLSGAGKTAVGQELCGRLRGAGRPVIFLDGDVLRAAIADDLGHEVDSRRMSALRNARLCRVLAEQGFDVICATISLFHEVQRWNRENIPGYREIYLRVPIDELRRRDSKDIYAKAHRGDLRNVVGLDVPAEIPKEPDLILDNYGEIDVATAVENILTACSDRNASNSAPPDPTVSFATKAESL